MFLDVDDDGDLDLIVAALPAPPGPEKLFVNRGSLGPGCLTQRKGAFTPFDDSTLDADVADFDGDGRIDFVTVQGESRRRETFQNRYYKNTGPPDTRAPKIGPLTPLETMSEKEWRGGRAVRAWIQDSAVDDGVTFVTATLCFRNHGSEGEVVRVPMPHIGGGIHRAIIGGSAAKSPTNPPANSRVEVWVEASDPAGNEARSPTIEVRVVTGTKL